MWLAHSLASVAGPLACAMADPVAILPPKPVQGHLQAADKDRIFEQTGCNVGTRQRRNWASICLSVSGPPEKLVEAPL